MLGFARAPAAPVCDDINDEDELEVFASTCQACKQRQNTSTIRPCVACMLPTCPKCHLDKGCKSCHTEHPLTNVDKDTLDDDDVLVCQSMQHTIRNKDKIRPRLDIEHLVRYKRHLDDDEVRGLRPWRGMLFGWLALMFHMPVAYATINDMTPDVPNRNNICKLHLAVGEEFYNTTRHDIVHPLFFAEFLDIHKRWCQLHNTTITWDIQEQWSGTSRFSRIAASFEYSVGFPIDYRYVWDLSEPKHRGMVDEAQRFFKPKLIASATDCRYWSCAGNTQDPDIKAQQRQRQL